MPARLLADMFRLEKSDRESVIASRDPHVSLLFDLAVSNINPAAVATIVRDSSASGGGPTILDELLSNGALAALNALRAAYGNIPTDMRVGRTWTDIPV